MKKLLAFTATIGAALCAGCSSDQPNADTIDVNGYIIGQANTVSVHGKDACTFYDGKVSAGTDAVIRATSGEVLGQGVLQSNSVEGYPTCAFAFMVDNIKSGLSNYTITVAPYEPLTISEDDLRKPHLGLSARSESDVYGGSNKAPISVSAS